MALNEHYNLLWRIGFRNVVTVLFPFFLLLVMNVKIVSVIRTTQFELISCGKLSEMQRKRRVRAATRTLLMIVFTYLLANVLNVILTFWEYIDIKSLTEKFLAFYTFGVDTVSILTILAGVLRKEFITFFEQHLTHSSTQYKEQRNVSNTFGYASTMILRISQILLKQTDLTGEDHSFDSTTDDDSSEVFL
ncbi:Protein T11F9.1 a [Aphelenchoides avenae]|nr:Protein T11F9.1 a [Aphelenchus avenae]